MAHPTTQISEDTQNLPQQKVCTGAKRITEKSECFLQQKSLSKEYKNRMTINKKAKLS